MKILITDTDTKITSVLKNGLNKHEIEVRDSLDNDSISNFNCKVIALWIIPRSFIEFV